MSASTQTYVTWLSSQGIGTPHGWPARLTLKSSSPPAMNDRASFERFGGRTKSGRES